CGAQMNHLHRVLLTELSSLGLSPRLNTTNGNHTRVEWNVGGKTHSIVTSTTPSDWRAVYAARAEIRRQLKALGFYPKAPLPKLIPLSSPEARLRNELIHLRTRYDETNLSVADRIRAIEVELAWRQRTQTNGDV